VGGLPEKPWRGAIRLKRPNPSAVAAP
jgi:hypothetical protein